MKVAIVANNALPVADPRVKGEFGGLETSAWLTARGLAQQPGITVALITRHWRRRKTQVIDNVRICVRPRFFEIVRESMAGRVRVTDYFPGFEVLHWHWSLTWKIPLLAAAKLLRAHGNFFQPAFATGLHETCDAAILFGVNAVSADAMRYFKTCHTKTILSIRSNADLDETFVRDPDFRNEYGVTSTDAKFVIEQADRILVQTVLQQRLLKERFGRESLVLGNPFDLKQWDEWAGSFHKLPFQPASGDYCLWVGRADRTHKRPLLMLDVAVLCPEIPFVMVLNEGLPDVRKEVEDCCPENVQLVERIPFELMPKLFRQARVFVTTGTSTNEGLPNVLIQAAASRTPTLGLDFLPEGFVESGAAVLSGSIPQLAEDLQRLWDNPQSLRESGHKARQYAESHFDLKHYSVQLTSLLHQTSEGVKST